MYLWNRQSFANLGLYRPNQAIQRGLYGDGLGQTTSVNLPLLIGGVALLGFGLFLFGGKVGPAYRRKRIARLAARRARISQKIAALES